MIDSILLLIVQIECHSKNRSGFRFEMFDLFFCLHVCHDIHSPQTAMRRWWKVQFLWDGMELTLAPLILKTYLWCRFLYWVSFIRILGGAGFGLLIVHLVFSSFHVGGMIIYVCNIVFI